MSHAAAHATLVFAQSSSAVQGTDKGTATGQTETEFRGSRLHK